MKIMIVDDNIRMRKAIIQAVISDNDELSECENGENALLQYEEFKPDWILMDIQMERMNGVTVAETILKKSPEVNIAFVTGFDNSAYRKKALSLGIKHYFLKSNLLEIRPTLDGIL